MWHISKEAAVDGTATTDHVDPHIQKLAMSDPEPGESGCGFVQTAQGLIELFTRVVEAQESTQLADEPTSMPIGWYVVRHVRVPFRSESVAGRGGRTSVGWSILRSAPGRFSPVDDDASTEHGTRRASWRGSTRDQGPEQRDESKLPSGLTLRSTDRYASAVQMNPGHPSAGRVSGELDSISVPPDCRPGPNALQHAHPIDPPAGRAQGWTMGGRVINQNRTTNSTERRMFPYRPRGAMSNHPAHPERSRGST